MGKLRKWCKSSGYCSYQDYKWYYGDIINYTKGKFSALHFPLKHHNTVGLEIPFAVSFMFYKKSLK